MLFFNPDAPQEEKGNAQSFQTHIPFRRVYKDTYMAWNKTNVITDVFFFVTEAQTQEFFLTHTFYDPGLEG